MSANTPTAENGTATRPRTRAGDKHYNYGPRYKSIGVDAEGGHHILQADDRIVYVVETGDNLDEDATSEVSHVVRLRELDNRTLGDWMQYVADKRGWESVEVTLIGFGGIANALGGEQ